MRRLLLLSALLLAAGCPAAGPSADVVDDTLEPPLEGQGFQLSIDITAPPGEEVWKCVVYPMPHEEISAVNSVEYIQSPGMHHMTLSTLGFNSADRIAHGEYDCETLYGESSLMQDQVMFFGAQGQDRDTMNLPENTAANFPLNMDVIHEVHFVNVSDEPVQIFSRVNAYTIPQDTVDEQIWGGQVRDETISIPAGGTATEWTRCEMNMDVEVLFLASHPTRWARSSRSAAGTARTPARFSIRTPTGTTPSSRSTRSPSSSPRGPASSTRALGRTGATPT
jgi:hypothetical protein